MARYQDLVVLENRVYSTVESIPQPFKSNLQKAIENNGESLDLEFLFGSSEQLAVKTILSESTSQLFHLVLGDPGDNISGYIIEDDLMVAEIGDGEIVNCTECYSTGVNENFQKYPEKSLRWLFDNNSELSWMFSSEDYIGRTLIDIERIAQFKLEPLPEEIPEDFAACNFWQTCVLMTDLFTEKRYVLRYSEQNSDFLSLRSAVYCTRGQVLVGTIEGWDKPHFQYARIADSHIFDVRAQFNDYDRLPWFYTN